MKNTPDVILLFKAVFSGISVFLVWKVKIRKGLKMGKNSSKIAIGRKVLVFF